MLIRRRGEDWESPKVRSYTEEATLQRLLAASPQLVPGVDPTTVFVDEFPLEGVGYCDLIGVSATGAITLVECKLSKNPEIRREVVGQLLAYAGATWQMPYEEFDLAFARRSGEPLASKLAATALPDWDEEAFRAAVTSNLSAGRFRLVFAVDKITDELKRTVLYLNAHTTTEMQVAALELGYAADDEIEILIPNFRKYPALSIDGVIAGPGVAKALIDSIESWRSRPA